MTRPLPLLAALLLAALAVPTVSAQPFTLEPTPLPTDDDDAVPVFVDYDADGDLDLAYVTGGTETVLYRNDGGSFVADVTGLPRTNSSGAWGDADNDGDLDLLLLGNFLTGEDLLLYTNSGGSLAPDGLGTDLTTPRLQTQAIDWGDVDGDGDLDFVIVAEDDPSNEDVLRVYWNDGGTFTDAEAGFGPWDSGLVTWGDYDADGDLDLFVSGTEGSSNDPSAIFRNDSGAFVQVAEISGDPDRDTGNARTGAWGDVDGDGDLDLAADEVLYLNEAGTFVEGQALSYGLLIGTLAWGDVDNDGDLDLLDVKQEDNSETRTLVWTNDGSGTLVAQDVGLTNIGRGVGRFADVDGDGDLDVFLSGQDRNSDDPTNRLFLNEIATANAAPSAPSDVTFTPADNTSGTLSWGASTDDTTPQATLSYNLRLGTTEGGSELYTAQSLPDGTRLVVGYGNVGLRRERQIGGLEPCVTYPYGVQAVDNGWRGGPFAEGSLATNLAPEVAGGVDDLTFVLGDGPMTVALEGGAAAFSDYPGDPLSYAVTGGAPDVAALDLSGPALTVTPASVGMATVTVSADDGVCGTASTTFTVAVLPTAPALAAPADGATGLGAPVALSWAASAGASGYDIQVARDTAFADLALDLSESSTSAPVEPLGGREFYWRVRATSDGGAGPWSPAWTFSLEYAVSDEDDPPAAFALAVPHPNPSRGAVRIVLTVPEAGPSHVEVLDALGRQVAVVHDGHLGAGEHPLAVEAGRLPAGTYLVRATAGDAVASRPLTVVR